MKLIAGAACVGLVVSMLVQRPVQAQVGHAYVLPPGALRVSGGGEYTRVDHLFGSSGRDPLAVGLNRPLVPRNFAPLVPLQAALTQFVAATASRPGSAPISVGDDSLTLGTPDAGVFLSSVVVPLRLAIGVAPRIQVAIGLPLARGRQLVQHLGLTGASVGPNADAARNGRLLGMVGGNGAALGALPWLPTQESALGRELQRRVRAATGDSLSLPSAAQVSAAALQSSLVRDFGVDSLRSRAGSYRPGDVELEVRVAVLDGLGGAPYPEEDAERSFRATAFAGIRLPTGSQPDSAQLFPWESSRGIPGFSVGGVGEMFRGRTLWVVAGARYVALGSTRVQRLASQRERPLSSAGPPVAVDWHPADTLEVRLSPRYRVAELISIGAEYRIGMVGASEYSGISEPLVAEGMNTPAGLHQRIGLGIEYSTLPHVRGGVTRLPLEVTLAYRRSLTGPEGAFAESGVEISGSLFGRLWGRGLRR